MSHLASDVPVSAVPRAIPMRESFWTWCRVAALSFGGPAGQIAVMHRILVDEKKWIDESRFLHALNYCMLLPGPEAQQLATYIGWLMHGARGGLMAGTLFVLPGFLAIMGLSVIYALWHDTGFIQAVFFGLKPAVLAIVVEAVLRIGKRVLKNSTMGAIAAASFIGIFLFGVPFPLIILAAGIIGWIGSKAAPARFQVLQGHKAKGGHIDVSCAKCGYSLRGLPREGTCPECGHEKADSYERAALLNIALRPVALLRDPPKPSLGRALMVSAICLPLWFIPVAAAALAFGTESVFVKEGVFFSKAAVVTFGGAYSVLAYVAQQAVEKYQWLKPGEMLDGLGMAETTPGPLIMVVQFVGFMGAFRNPGSLSPMTAAVMGAMLTTWVTFVPCFYWIFLGAPYIERLRGHAGLNAALSSITAAVVGVVLNLAVWFALHTLFAQAPTWEGWGLKVIVPQWSSLRLMECGLAALAMLLTFYFKRGMATTLATCCALGALAWVLTAKP